MLDPVRAGFCAWRTKRVKQMLDDLAIYRATAMMCGKSLLLKSLKGELERLGLNVIEAKLTPKEIQGRSFDYIEVDTSFRPGSAGQLYCDILDCHPKIKHFFPDEEQD